MVVRLARGCGHGHLSPARTDRLAPAWSRLGAFVATADAVGWHRLGWQNAHTQIRAHDAVGAVRLAGGAGRLDWSRLDAPCRIAKSRRRTFVDRTAHSLDLVSVCGVRQFLA